MHISTPTSKDRNKRNAQYEVCRKKKNVEVHKKQI